MPSPAPPRPVPAAPAPPPGAPPSTPAPEPSYRPPSLRALLGLLLVTVLLGGLAYPAAVTGFAQLVTPGTADGSLLYNANGTAIASKLIGQNITNASLFWLRPSLTDWQVTTGSGESPYGPTDPALLVLLNATIAAYGLTNTTVPLDLVSPSESGIDPDVSELGALVQIPRVAAHSHLSEATLTQLVERELQPPLLGFLGPSYVNVVELDLALLATLGG